MRYISKIPSGDWLMRSWVVVVAVWFMSAFICIVIVSFLGYQEFNKRKRRWNNNPKPFPQWVFLLLLLAAFMVGIIWFAVECSGRQNDFGNKRKAWWFIGLFTGAFALVCFLVSIYWKKFQKFPFTKRNIEEDTYTASSSIPTENNIHRNFESLTRRPKDEDEQITSNWNHGMALDSQEDILVLRDLADPQGEYWLNLSNSSAPVIRRQQLQADEAIDEVLVHQVPLQKSKVLTIQGGFTTDLQC